MESYKGFYKPSKKYKGNSDSVIYRSLLELATFIWLDSNPRVLAWSSEETIINYICPTDNKNHRYFPDLKIWYDKKVLIVEIKPRRQLSPPKQKKRNSKRYLAEVKTYFKNKAKWEAAIEFCKDRNYIFEIWTEDVLKSLGVKIT